MSFVVLTANPERPPTLLTDNKGNIRSFTTLKKAERAASRATEGETKAKAFHKNAVPGAFKND